jgi:hypothetical protein
MTVDEVTERRRILLEERRLRTYHGHARHTDEDLYSGRFKQVTTTNVVGSGPISYPQQPTGSPWAKDECPPEPSLGYSVEEQEPVGEMFEREAPVISRQGAEGGGPTQAVPNSKLISPR